MVAACYLAMFLSSFIFDTGAFKRLGCLKFQTGPCEGRRGHRLRPSRREHQQHVAAAGGMH